MSATARPKTAMVLSGGGAYGAYEAGVMLALFRGESPATGGMPLEVDLFACTSIGAYNGAVMTAYSRLGFAEAAERLVGFWLERLAQPAGGCNNGVFRLRGSEVLRPDCAVRPSSLGYFASDGLYALREFLPRAPRFVRLASASTPDPLTRAILIQIDFTTLLDLAPFIETIKRTVPLDGLRWRTWTSSSWPPTSTPDGPKSSRSPTSSIGSAMPRSWARRHYRDSLSPSRSMVSHTSTVER